MDVQASGSLVVEMLDAGTGKAVAGHAAQDCVPIMGNYVDVRTPESWPRPQFPRRSSDWPGGCVQVAVQWQGSGASSSLLSAGLAGQRVQLRFLLKGDVDLFSSEVVATTSE